MHVVAEIERQLRRAATHLVEYGIDALPDACACIPLEVFGAIQIDRPEVAARLLDFLPTMPPDDIQLLWTGSSGHPLLANSIAFIRTLVSTFPPQTARRGADIAVLDFGCGWGRLLRLACKYVRPSGIWAVDPWERSIEVCQAHSVLGNLRQSPWIPRTLDVPDDLDLVYAFSVFTHLPQEIAAIAFRTLQQHLVSQGRLVLTVRPVEYWALHDFSESGPRGYSKARAETEHGSADYAFVPFNHSPIEGIVAYGDSSMTVEHAARLAAPLRLIGLERNAIDPMQLVLIFQKP